LDAAVTAVDAPASVAVREPFQLSATVHASAAIEGTVSLLRDGKVLARGPTSLRAGPNLLRFRDLLERPGAVAYEVRVEVAQDGVPENDVGRAVLRVEGAPRVLLLSAAGEQGAVARTLRDAGLELEVRAPGPLTLSDLDGVGALVLEDVGAQS